MSIEEFDYVVIVESEARGSEVLRVGGQIQFPAYDAGLKLGGTIATVAEAL